MEKRIRLFKNDRRKFKIGDKFTYYSKGFNEEYGLTAVDELDKNGRRIGCKCCFFYYTKECPVNCKGLMFVQC